MRIRNLLAIILLLSAAIAIMINRNMPDFSKTSDGVKIAYDLYEAKNPKGWLILTHMMPATKESWKEFANLAKEFGYESIAIDLRGHGESTTAEGEKGKVKSLDYRKFSDEEHQASIKDLEAAWEFLESRGAKPEKTALIGASIGANLSLQFLVENPDLKKGVLLSPGLDYRGVKTELLAKKLKKDQSLIFATSKDDGDNFAQNQKLYDLAPSANKHLIIFDFGGHGTNMFSAKDEFDLAGAILKFLENGNIN